VDGHTVGAPVPDDLDPLEVEPVELTQVETLGEVVGLADHQHEFAARADVLCGAVDGCSEILRAVWRLDDRQRVSTSQLDARPVATDDIDRRSPRAQP